MASRDSVACLSIGVGFTIFAELVWFQVGGRLAPLIAIPSVAIACLLAMGSVSHMFEKLSSHGLWVTAALVSSFSLAWSLVLFFVFFGDAGIFCELPCGAALQEAQCRYLIAYVLLSFFTAPFTAACACAPLPRDEEMNKFSSSAPSLSGVVTITTNATTATNDRKQGNSGSLPNPHSVSLMSSSVSATIEVSEEESSDVSEDEEEHSPLLPPRSEKIVNKSNK